MRHAVRLDMIDESRLKIRIIVAVVQRRAAGEEVDILRAIMGRHLGTACRGEHGVKPPAIAACLGFTTSENCNIGGVRRHTASLGILEIGIDRGGHDRKTHASSCERRPLRHGYRDQMFGLVAFLEV